MKSAGNALKEIHVPIRYENSVGFTAPEGKDLESETRIRRLQAEGLERLILKAKSRPRIAEFLGLTRAAIQKWRFVPLDHVPALEEHYQIPRWLLRPDHYLPPEVELERWRALEAESLCPAA